MESTYAPPPPQVTPYHEHSVPGALNAGVPTGGHVPEHQSSFLVQPPPFVLLYSAIKAARSAAGIAAVACNGIAMAMITASSDGHGEKTFCITLRNNMD
jgi:hypothetical protein